LAYLLGFAAHRNPFHSGILLKIRRAARRFDHSKLVKRALSHFKGIE
jgi:hypothetical protein